MHALFSLRQSSRTLCTSSSRSTNGANKLFDICSETCSSVCAVARAVRNPRKSRLLTQCCYAAQLEETAMTTHTRFTQRQTSLHLRSALHWRSKTAARKHSSVYADPAAHGCSTRKIVYVQATKGFGRTKEAQVTSLRRGGQTPAPFCRIVAPLAACPALQQCVDEQDNKKDNKPKKKKPYKPSNQASVGQQTNKLEQKFK